MRVPNSPKTPHHSFRIPEDLYQQALAKARANGEQLVDIVRLALKEYVEADSGDEPKAPGDGQS